MCDLTTVEYHKDEVVWVKLSNLWWPGQVQDYDALPQEIKADFKKEPIAVVKFFQEETFEYVKNTNNIYRYNCLKKNEFIKKGLDMMRSTRVSTSNMQMFPVDIVTAEKLTNGDPNILSRPEFQPPDDKEVGKSVYEDLFSSSPNTKKSKKDTGGLSTSIVGGGGGVGSRSVYSNSSTSRKDQFLKRKSLPNKMSHPTPVAARHITHPRFNLNFTDPGQNYECKELIQEPSSMNLPSTGTANGDVTTSWFKCPDCSYECTRVNVMLLHYRAHSRKYDHKIKYPAGEKRKKKSVQSASGSGGVGGGKKIKLSNGELSGGSSGGSKNKLAKNDAKGDKRKSSSEVASQQQQPKEVEKSTLNFLEDWDDDDDEEETDVSGLVASMVAETPPKHQRTLSTTETTKEEEKASCFDFEESEKFFTTGIIQYPILSR